MFKRINIIFFNLFLFFLFLPIISYACFSPTDSFAVEVLLNKSNLTYNLADLKQKNTDEILIREDAIIYRSHYNPEIAVILEETEQSDLCPKCLSVRIQIPTEQIETENGFDLKPAIKIDPDQFDWQNSLKTELLWLINNQIISGLTNDDLNLIYQVAARGTAGYNRKIVWGISPETKEYQWLPYDKTENPLLIKRLADCSGFALNLLPKKQLTLLPRVFKNVSNRIIFWLALSAQLLVLSILIIYILFFIKKIIGQR
jgi:hypothetical protein